MGTCSSNKLCGWSPAFFCSHAFFYHMKHVSVLKQLRGGWGEMAFRLWHNRFLSLQLLINLEHLMEKPIFTPTLTNTFHFTEASEHQMEIIKARWSQVEKNAIQLPFSKWFIKPPAGCKCLFQGENEANAYQIQMLLLCLILICYIQKDRIWILCQLISLCSVGHSFFFRSWYQMLP